MSDSVDAVDPLEWADEYYDDDGFDSRMTREIGHYWTCVALDVIADAFEEDDDV